MNIAFICSYWIFEDAFQRLRFPITFDRNTLANFNLSEAACFSRVLTCFSFFSLLSLAHNFFVLNNKSDKNGIRFSTKKATVLIQSSLDSWLKMRSLFVFADRRKCWWTSQIYVIFFCVVQFKWNGKLVFFPLGIKNVIYFLLFFTTFSNGFHSHSFDWFIQFTFRSHCKSFALAIRPCYLFR